MCPSKMSLPLLRVKSQSGDQRFAIRMLDVAIIVELSSIVWLTCILMAACEMHGANWLHAVYIAECQI
jgi:hypothetical protein